MISIGMPMISDMARITYSEDELPSITWYMEDGCRSIFLAREDCFHPFRLNRYRISAGAISPGLKYLAFMLVPFFWFSVRLIL